MAGSYLAFEVEALEQKYTAEGAAIMVLGPQPQLITGSEGLLKILGQPASPAVPRGDARSSGRYRWWYKWAWDYLAPVARWVRCSRL
jgi:hypothetical protein